MLLADRGRLGWKSICAGGGAGSSVAQLTVWHATAASGCTKRSFIMKRGLTFAGIATVMTVHLSLPWMDRITGWKYDAVMIGGY